MVMEHYASCHEPLQQSKQQQPLLSPRETAVLVLIARGHTNREIASNLAISGQTLKNHIQAILLALNVQNRTAAVIYGLQEGWIALPEKGMLVKHRARRDTRDTKENQA